MTTTPTTRVSLLFRLRDWQDHEAWMEFVSLYEPVVYRLLRRHGLQDADAREVMQDLLLAVSRSIERWDPAKERGSFRGWLRQVTRNLVINWLKQRERRVPATGDSDLQAMLDNLPADSGLETVEFDQELRRSLFQQAAEQVRGEVQPATWQAFWETAVVGTSSESAARKLRWGIVAGTPEYMSPEQARGEPLDGRSDLFSLGCVLYQMATGVSPFRTDSMLATMRRLVDDAPQALAALNPGLPPWFVAIVERLLEKDPSRRFGSAKEVSELLEGCLAHLQQPASVPLPAALPAPAARGASRLRKTLVKGTMALIATLVIALLGILAVQTTEPPDIAGHWSGEGWGQFVLIQTAAGEYAGTYSDTEGKEPGKIDLKWSRIERRFNGMWREGQNRFGQLSLRLADREIRGALTTDPKSMIKPAAPRLADLVWTRVETATSEAPPTADRVQDGAASFVRKEYDIDPVFTVVCHAGEPEDGIDLITSVIHPETWDDAGGPGTIVVTNEKRLSILQTPAIHAQVAKLLEVLKKMPAFQQQGATRLPPKHYVVTEGKADADLGIVVYDVTDLVPTDDYHALVHIILGIEPTSWNAVGGPGSCAVCPQAKALVILQTQAMHRQLQDSLRLYRQKPTAFGSLGPPASKRDQKLAAQADPHEQLRQQLSLSLRAVPLPKALAQLAEKMHVNIVLDEAAIRQAGIPADTQVTIDVRVPERASAVLKLILQPRRLGYTVEGRSIRVTTPENVETTLYVRVYSVGDLLTPVAGEAFRGKDQAADPNAGPVPQKPRHDFRSLISLITGTVEPPSWDGVGGPGKIEPFEARSSLVITQTQPVHEQIADLFDELRRRSTRQPSKPAESPTQQQFEGGSSAGGFFSTDAGFPRSPVAGISTVTAVSNSLVAPRQEHVGFVALQQAAGQDIPMQRLPALGHSCGDLWYLPDGKTLVSTFGGIEHLPGRPVPNEDPRVGQVAFWDTSTWETKAVLGTGANRLIRGASLAISPDGSRLAVSAENQFVAVWDIFSSTMPAKPVWKDAWDGGRNATRWVHCVAFRDRNSRQAEVSSAIRRHEAKEDCQGCGPS